jgi:hypothetical protein
MSGIKGGKDTGTKSVTAGNIALTTVVCIGRGTGSGTASGDSHHPHPHLQRRSASNFAIFSKAHQAGDARD